LWNQLVQLDWPREAADELRYITNSGGAMPRTTTERLRSALPDTRIYLMYGLTEAFRSTYLPPEQVDKRPDSMGKAIPNAEILVVREDGSECAPGEPGELVHRGSLVAMGYWNDPDKTAERFRPSPGQARELPLSEIAVWSGDQVRRDEEGYLYFISRKDDMIKTSGYRVSPTEIEEVVYGMAGVTEVAAVGLPHPTLGQAILLVVVCGADIAEETIMAHCKKELPNFMLPRRIMTADELPRNQNGKIDRKQLFQTHELLFQESES
jgi:acyl-coenzyme A synthetase/AMP-(fatty) acid ligase